MFRLAAIGLVAVAAATYAASPHLDSGAHAAIAGQFEVQDSENCEPMASGMEHGLCARHWAKLGEQRRKARLAVIGRNWSPHQKKLFQAAYAGALDYGRAVHEMDCFGGTAQGACATAGANQWMEEFVDRIEAIHRGQADELVAKTDARRREMAKQAATLQAQEAGRERVADEYWQQVRGFYEQNERDKAAKRVIFEKRLVAFAKPVFPNVTSHRIRRIFADM